VVFIFFNTESILQCDIKINLRFLKNLIRKVTDGFGASSSGLALPSLMEKLEKKMGCSKP
jgi:Na+/H+-dicarboxylate symporter